MAFAQTVISAARSRTPCSSGSSPASACAEAAPSRRYAAFFAMRRALVRARAKLIPELRGLLNANPDPCLRQQVFLAHVFGG